MIIRILSLLCCTVCLISCSGLNTDRERDPRDRDRVGDYDVDLPEEVGEAGFLNIKCEIKGQPTPVTIIDIFTTTLNLPNPELTFRTCLEQKLQEANSRICDSRYKLETLRDRYEDDDNEAAVYRVEHQLFQLDQIEQKFKANLEKLSTKIQRQSDNPPTRGSVLKFLFGEYTFGYEVVFSGEARMRCRFNNNGRRSRDSRRRDNGYRREDVSNRRFRVEDRRHH